MIPNKLKSSKENKKSPLLTFPQSGTKTKNSILQLPLAGEPSQRASQQPLFPTGGVYLKKSELILRAIGSAGGIPPKPPSARLALKRKRKGRFQVFLILFCSFFSNKIKNQKNPSNNNS